MKNIKWPIIIIVCSCLIIGTLYLTNTNSDETSEYVFVQVSHNIHGENIEGVGPQMMIDFPTYRINETAESITGSVLNSPDVANIKAIIGSYSSNSGDYGGGASSSLTVFEYLPVSSNFTRFLNFSINIDEDNKVYINDSIELIPGEIYYYYNEYIQTGQMYDNSTYRMKVTETISIKYYGIWETANLEFD